MWLSGPTYGWSCIRPMYGKFLLKILFVILRYLIINKFINFFNIHIFKCTAVWSCGISGVCPYMYSQIWWSCLMDQVIMMPDSKATDVWEMTSVVNSWPYVIKNSPHASFWQLTVLLWSHPGDYQAVWTNFQFLVYTWFCTFYIVTIALVMQKRWKSF